MEWVHAGNIREDDPELVNFIRIVDEACSANEADILKSASWPVVFLLARKHYTEKGPEGFLSRLVSQVFWMVTRERRISEALRASLAQLARENEELREQLKPKVYCLPGPGGGE